MDALRPLLLVSSTSSALKPAPSLGLVLSMRHLVSAPLTPPRSPLDWALEKKTRRAQTFIVQALLRQSALPAQAFPPRHLGHIAPPQSASVSAPFFTPS